VSDENGMFPTIQETAHAARVAFLAASVAHARIMARRAARLSPKPEPWSAGALDRLLVDLDIAP